MHVIDGRLRFDESNSRAQGVLMQESPHVALDVALKHMDAPFGPKPHMVDSLAQRLP